MPWWPVTSLNSIPEGIVRDDCNVNNLADEFFRRDHRRDPTLKLGRPEVWEGYLQQHPPVFTIKSGTDNPYCVCAGDAKLAPREPFFFFTYGLHLQNLTLVIIPSSWLCPLPYFLVVINNDLKPILCNLFGLKWWLTSSTRNHNWFYPYLKYLPFIVIDLVFSLLSSIL